MDVFKLAFETTIVGLLAFLWLGLATDLLFPNFFMLVFGTVPDKYQTPLGVGALLLAYCLASAILPISNQLLNDEHWPLSEDAIRCMVFVEHERQRVETDPAEALKPEARFSEFTTCHHSFWDPVFSFISLIAGGKGGPRDIERDAILMRFQLEDSTILSRESQSESDQLRQLHQRIVVLRGAVFSGLVLLLVYLFGCLAREYGHPFQWKRAGTLCGLALAVLLTGFSLYTAYMDLQAPSIFDIPVLETVMCVVNIFGGFLVLRGVRTRPFLRLRYLLLVGFFAALTYGGWMASEISYDQQVVTSFAIPQTAPDTKKP
jgi:hypothetical protein